MTHPTCSSTGAIDQLAREHEEVDELARQYIRTHAALDHVLDGTCMSSDHPRCAVTRAVQEKFTVTLKGYIP